jgi:tryptophanyl-tRNA synthetase
MRELAAFLLASGVDPKRSAVFVQSQIGAHAELAWIWSCVIPQREGLTVERIESPRHVTGQFQM